MTPRLFIALAVGTLVVGACASQRDNASVDLIPPLFRIQQIRTVGYAARNISGPVTVNYLVDIENQSGEVIHLYQIRMETVGEGAYELVSTQRPFEIAIEPGATERVEFWGSASASDTILGVNGPATIRATAHFKSAVGSFQKIYIQQLNDGMGDQPSPIQ